MATLQQLMANYGLSEQDAGRIYSSAMSQYQPAKMLSGSPTMFSVTQDPMKDVNASRQAWNDRQLQELMAKSTQSFAKSQGNKQLFLQAGGQVDPLDPWGFYRETAGDRLFQFIGQQDPSNVYLSKLQQMTMGEFSPDDPSYKWRFEQGQQAVERSLAARGLLNSGNAAIELQQYGQGAASQEYAAQFDRLLRALAGVDAQYNNQFSRLAQMAGINLNPAASSQLAIESQGQALDFLSRNNALNEEQRQFNVGQQNLANYNEGLRTVLTNYGSPAMSMGR
jgi:hypothetical protein